MTVESVGEDEALAHLAAHYARIVDEKFDGIVPRDFTIEFNPLLRRLTGRITYGRRLIEIATFHFRQYGLGDAVATLEHELLHLYLHERGRPSGHTAEFKRLALARGIRVFHENPYPKNTLTPYRYLYECPHCQRMVSRMRPTGAQLACGVCCREHAGGAWDGRYELQLLRKVRMV